MRLTNFCTTCGAHLGQKSWRLWLRGPICQECLWRRGNATRTRSMILLAAMVIGAFAFGRWLRPPPPPLIIQRAADSPLSDLPVNLKEITKRTTANAVGNEDSGTSSADDTVYLCGARTKKGTPCKRRVHTLGERCYQHKGRPAMVPLEKLVIKP